MRVHLLWSSRFSLQLRTKCRKPCKIDTTAADLLAELEAHIAECEAPNAESQKVDPARRWDLEYPEGGR
jgi:hypothetical protein